MAVRLTKPWTPLTPETVRRLPGQLGVYELADPAGATVRIGMAGGRSLFGLKGEIERALADPPAGADRFRFEVTASYRTRWLELMMAFRHDHGRLPAGNPASDAHGLGRLSPG
jgi:hypothetical protein